MKIFFHIKKNNNIVLLVINDAEKNNIHEKNIYFKLFNPFLVELCILDQDTLVYEYICATVDA